MAKILLTSSQVSLLVSSVIIVFCTLALFLSGYVIQQRTLRELRIAIKPRESRPSPKVHLPDRFKATTTELEDGTILVIGEEAEEQKQEQEVLVEVKPTLPEQEEKKQQEEEEPKKDKAEIVAELSAKIAEQSNGVEYPDPLVKNPKPISRAERRRLIKQEIRRLAQSDKPLYYQRRLW
ncbi:Fc.00g058960.m01.CDS01 [Cosmosporella sp. VM-42]